MCQYVLVFRAVIKLRHEEGSLNISNFMYLRRLVRSLDRQMTEIDRQIKKKSCKKVKKRSRKAKNKN